MELTDGEKLTILMLTEIYDKLAVDGDFDPEFLRSAIFNDATWSIPWKYSGIPFARQETPQVVKEVIDVLDLWSLIELSYERLSELEKNQLAERLPTYVVPPVFRGFDGNNESDHMGAAYFVINQLDRFVEFKGRDLNSHIQLLTRYRTMLTKLEELPRTSDYLLTVESLGEILQS